MKRIAIALAAFVAIGIPAYAQTPDISGKWEVTIVTPQGSMPPSPLELKKEGDKFVGMFYTPQGNADVEATIKDKVVTILLPPFQTPQGPITIGMTGTLDGDTMKGTLDLGGMGQMDWSAQRTAPAQAKPEEKKPEEKKPEEQKPEESKTADAKIDVSGTWLLEVSTMGGTGTPTLELKQDGEKLSGHYTGRYGDAPISGTIKGAEFTFSFAMGSDGNTATITYTGKVDKDTMKGTLTLADMGEGTFTGKKK